MPEDGHPTQQVAVGRCEAVDARGDRGLRRSRGGTRGSGPARAPLRRARAGTAGYRRIAPASGRSVVGAGSARPHMARRWNSAVHASRSSGARRRWDVPAVVGCRRNRRCLRDGGSTQTNQGRRGRSIDEPRAAARPTLRPSNGASSTVDQRGVGKQLGAGASRMHVGQSARPGSRPSIDAVSGVSASGDLERRRDERQPGAGATGADAARPVAQLALAGRVGR